jgi:hypothetical protein
MLHLTSRRSRLVSAVAAGGLALGLAVSAAAPASAAPTAGSVTFVATPAVTVGQPVPATAVIVGAVDVYSYAVTFTFDPAVITYTPGSATTGPAGGFDAVSEAAGAVTVLHSRLGTSPSIAGDLPVSVGFATIASGDTAIAVSVSLVDTAGATTALPAAATTRVAVAALPIVAPPVPSPSPSVTPSAADPAAQAATPVTVTRNADGSLALTGLDSGILVGLALLGLAALVIGFVLVRRRVASTR